LEALSYSASGDQMSESTQEQIARLQVQVDALMRDRVTPIVADAASRVQGAVDAVHGQAENVSSRVEQRPLSALLVAAGVGFILGRAM
jgi:ElaB/YqjD/DUF883 family membrane-anchored ribosome-binding protein